MADIFSTEPPRWLQEIAKPIDTKLTGQTLGMLAGGLFNAARSGKESADAGNGSFLGESFKAIPREMNSAWMNQQDPMWRLKAKSMQLSALHQERQLSLSERALDLNTLKAKADMTRDDTNAKWLAEDLVNLKLYSDKDREQRLKEPGPVLKTPEGARQYSSMRSDDENWYRFNYDKKAVGEWNDKVMKFSALADELGNPQYKSLAARLVSGGMGKKPDPTDEAILASAYAGALTEKRKTVESKYEGNPLYEKRVTLDADGNERSTYTQREEPPNKLSETDRALLASDIAGLKKAKEALALATKDSEKKSAQEQIDYFERKVRSYGAGGVQEVTDTPTLEPAPKGLFNGAADWLNVPGYSPAAATESGWKNTTRDNKWRPMQ